MTPRTAPDCAHERRPGTTVCLYCRAEERAVVRRRRLRHLGRLGAFGAGAVVLVAVTLAGIRAFGAGAPATDAPAAVDAPASVTRFAATQAGTDRGSAAPASSPVVPIGRTALPGGVYAERTGDTVTVHFDTRDARTRRSDKFENVVRRTLPLILGEPARMALEHVAPGTLVAPGALVAASGSDPLRLPVGDGRVVTVAPGTRMGQDGPLVVTYRAVVDASAQAPTS